ncbi:MAG: hypothetical protein ACPGSG_11485 [Prolixibacteraceae bacterium]
MVFPISKSISLSVVEKEGELSIMTCHSYLEDLYPIDSEFDSKEAAGIWLEYNEGIVNSRTGEDYPTEALVTKDPLEIIQFISDVLRSKQDRSKG